MQDKVIKPSYPPGSGRAWFDVRIGADLGNDARARLLAQIDADPDAYTVQNYLPLSQAPTWNGNALVPRAAMVRVFAIADADGQWHALPGGLTRVAAHRGRLVSMQRGGSSMDTWVQTDDSVDQFSMLPEPLRPEDLAHKRRVVTSRAAENLFWMGRYAERADFGARLARYLLRLLTDDMDSPPAVNEAMMQLATANGLVPPGTPSPSLSTTVFERTLIATLADPDASSVRASLNALGRTGGQIRDRLSAEHWRLVTSATSAFVAEPRSEEAKLAADEVIAALTQVSVHMAAITGAQTDRMTRDDGWRLLSAGRQLERLYTLALALESCISTGAALLEDGFDLLLGLFDSTITYHSLYQRRLEMPPLVDLLVLEPANPRSLARAARVLKRELARLPADGADAMQLLIPEPASWPPLRSLCERGADGRHDALLALIDRLLAGATTLSDAIGERYFSHAGDAYRAMVV